MRAYVINLARSPERREHMVGQLENSGIDYEFVEGVEGRDLNLADTSLVAPKWLGRSPLWPGAVGCLLGHLKVYNKVIEDGAEVAMVLEDDVVFPPDIGSLVASAAAGMTGAEAVLLQYFSYFSAQRGEPCQFRKTGSVQLPSSRVLALPLSVADLGGAGAYLVTREACQRMAKTVLPIRAPADDWAFYCNEGALDSLRCVLPMPVRINSGFRTTIDHYPAGTLQTRLRETVVKIPGLNQVLTFRRRRIMAQLSQVELLDDSRS